MIDFVQKICRAYGTSLYLHFIFLPIYRLDEASNQEFFAIKKCRFAAALKKLCCKESLLSYNQPETITVNVHNFQCWIFF